MQGSSNTQIGSFKLPQDQNKTQFVTFSHAHAIPIIAQPQFSKNCNETANCDPANSKAIADSGKPYKYSADIRVQNIRPWPKPSYPSDQSTRLNSSESVIINFDNTNEPSTSHSQDLYSLYTSEVFSEQFQPNSTCSESTRANDHNLSNNTKECNIDVESQNNRYSNQNNNSVNNNSNNNNNSTSFYQNNEETNRNQNLGNQSLEKIFNKYIPFVVFLSLKAIYDHREGILIFVGLLVTFIHANSVVKREIAKQSRRSLKSLGIIFVNLFVSIWFIYFVFQDQKIYKNLIFIPPYSQPLNIWDVLWIAGITDFVLKFITMQLKVVMACFPAKVLPFTARGKWYLMLERASQLYRSLAPIQSWLYYLMEVYQGPENIVGIFFSVAYVILKGSDVMSKAKLLSSSVWKLMHNASLGIHPSNEQLITAGSQCPICHDEFNSPVLLQCRHIFCESCVSIWFDREQNCPLCRAKIADDPSWRDGATSFFTQLF